MIITHVEYVACPNTPEGRRYATMVEQEFRDRQIKCGTHTTTTSIVVGYEESFSFKPPELEQKYSRKKRGSAYDKCGVQAVSRGREAAPEADTEAAQAADLRSVGGLGADYAHELGADAEREIP